MKIHSKFRDYYDSAMAYGVDDHVHWVRRARKIQVGTPVRYRHAPEVAHDKNIEYLDSHLFLDSDMYREAPRSRERYGGYGKHKVGRESAYFPYRDVFFIGFCGRLYCGMRFSWENPDSVGEKICHHAYNVDDVIKILEKFDKRHKTKHAEKFINEKPNLKSNAWRDSRACDFNKTELERYFEKYENAEYVDFFVDFNSPVFIVFRSNQNSGGMTVNPVLVDYEFQKVMDPYTAYQEIEMFMGGVLTELDEIDVPGVGDEDLKEAKGFDDWSFKKLPTKKR